MQIATTVQSRIHAELTCKQSYSLAALIAICFIAYLFPLSFLQGQSTVTDFGDISQHIAGWWFYMHEPWHLPLLHTYKLDHPEGVSIVFTDSIPIAALFFKLLITLFPNAFDPHFHYFGWWIGFVFVAQALAATFLIRAMGAKSWFAMVIAVGFALTWPVLHARYHHSALMTQSIILFGLGFYWLGQTQVWSSQRAYLSLLGLNVFALMVHPYYFAMTASLLIAFLVDRLIKGETWLLQAKRFFALAVILSVLFWLLGYYQAGTLHATSQSNKGYGTVFALNLMEPFCGAGKLIACGQGPEFAFPYRESFNYLGAGLLFLIPIAVILNWKQLLNLPKQSPSLLALIIGLFFYAVTNQVRMGDTLVWSFSLPAWLSPLTSAFRAAGRFFWPVSLFILFITLASLFKKKSWLISILLVLAMVMQIKDVKPWLLRIKSESAKPSVLNYKEWELVFKEADKIVIYPINECPPLHYQHSILIMRLAGYYEKQLNSGYTARGYKDCRDDTASLNAALLPRHLYVLSSGAYSQTPFAPTFTFSEPFIKAMEQGECVRRLDDMLCLQGSTPAFWQSLPLLTSPVKSVKNGRQWMPTEISTRIGITQGRGDAQRLVPIDLAREGWLGFGPFVYLTQGKYRFAIDYSSSSAPDTTVGNWDVMLNNSSKLHSGQFKSTSDRLHRIEGYFLINKESANQAIEIRSYYLAKGDLQIQSTSLQKISD